jgi:lipopolysaccharide transport system ATP-binding protein
MERFPAPRGWVAAETPPTIDEQIIVSPTAETARIEASGARAISLCDASKRYPLYPSVRSRVLDVFGIRRWLPNREPIPEYEALRGVTLDIGRGERVGVIGRNGAGKSTLLKLVSGFFGPSSGRVATYGRVSAILDIGLGFHEDFSGIENIRASLSYNGLTAAQTDAAVNDVIEYCELGPFLELPIKTYSSGMKARLSFAVATAIQPDILIIDEILGAGDAYFWTRSAERMAQFAKHEITLMLVSHNLGQIAGMCERAIWIEAGAVRLDGPAAEVVAAYVEFSAELERRSLEAKYGTEAPESADRWIRRRLLSGGRRSDNPDPAAMPVVVEARLRDAGGGNVRRLEACQILDVEIEIRLRQRVIALRVRPVVCLFTADGRLVDRSVGPTIALERDESPSLVMRYAPLLTGPGEFLVTGGVVNVDRREETFCGLFVRSLRFEVTNKDPTETSLVLQPATWTTALQQPDD